MPFVHHLLPGLTVKVNCLCRWPEIYDTAQASPFGPSSRGIIIWTIGQKWTEILFLKCSTLHTTRNKQYSGAVLFQVVQPSKNPALRQNPWLRKKCIFHVSWFSKWNCKFWMQNWHYFMVNFAAPSCGIRSLRSSSGLKLFHSYAIIQKSTKCKSKLLRLCFVSMLYAIWWLENGAILKFSLLGLVYILVSGIRWDFWCDVNETKYARM